MILIRIKSHRAYDKIKRAGIQARAMFNFTEGNFYQVSETDLSDALKIKGVSRARKPKGVLMDCW